jgi:inosine/xanthosine triphosphate pyrophosphatase family protein
MGSVYRWDISGLGDVYGATMRAGAPCLILSDGATAVQVPAQYRDISAASASTAVLRSFETGELEPVGLQRQFNLSRVQFLGEYESPHTLSLKVFPNFATSATPATKTVTAAPEQFVTRPPSCMRLHSARMRIDEGSTTEAAAGGIQVRITTTGANVVALDQGFCTVAIATTAGTYSAGFSPGDFRDDAATQEVTALLAGTPAASTITVASITIINPFSGPSVATVTMSVRRQGGTAGEIFNAVNVADGSTKTVSGLSLAGSLQTQPVYGSGFKFIGFALEVQDAGKIANLDVGRII